MFNINYVGHFDLNESFIKDVRYRLRQSGFRLWVRGGNPDRKQHVGKKLTNGEFSYTARHSALRQSLPLVFSTYGRYYIRVTEIHNVINTMTLQEAMDTVSEVTRWYEKRGVNLKTNVPVKA